MKAYIITDKEKNVLAWASTQALARAGKKTLASEGAKSWEEVEVPTAKADLIGFLNKNCVAINLK